MMIRSIRNRTPDPSWLGGDTSPMEKETLPGLVLSADELFTAKLRAGLTAAWESAALHRFSDLDEAAMHAGMHRYAYALVDARAAPMQAGALLAGLLQAAPRLPVILCLGPGEVRPPEKHLRALGAFEIVTAADWPGEHLLAAINHAVWFAAIANDAPAAGVAEGDRPLLAEVSHEMRSPLNSIIGFAESIEQQTLGPWPAESERYRDYARHIRNSGEHLLALFNDLLSIGDADAFAIDMGDRIDPAALARNVAAMMRPAAERKGLTLTCATPPEAGLLQCNARFVSQALLNLLQNAVKFTGAGGSVALAVRQDDGGTRFTVTDTGVGFPPERLLQPRNARYGRTAASGHGLGLRFVERVAAAHRGRLEIESQRDRGTEIAVTFPASPAPGPAADG